MVFIPNISTAKPISIVPKSFFFAFFENIIRTIPINARTGENDVGLSKFVNRFPPSTPARLKIHDVTVVPILAPIITLIAWDSFIIPEFTKPTTMTVVADED